MEGNNMNYLNFNENEGYITDFYEILFTINFERLALKHLINYCDLKGCYVNDEMVCVFSSELQTDDEDYFGENKVAYYFFEPAVKEDKQIVISYQEFYDIVYKYYSEYARQHSEEQDEIMRLLAELKNKLNVKQ